MLLYQGLLKRVGTKIGKAAYETVPIGERHGSLERADIRPY